MMNHEKLIKSIFKTSKLRSRLCDYNAAYILVSANITASNTAAAGAAASNRKNISKIYKTKR